MQLRNAILIALAMDATPQEIEHAHDTIDRIFGADGKGNGVAPEYLVNQIVPSTDAATGQTANGLQTTQPTQQGHTSADVARDKNGIPYDERIHSSSKDNRLNADGTWRAKRGVDKAFAKRVEAELLATVNAGPPSGPAPTPTPAPTPAATQQPPMPGGNLPPMPGQAAIDPAYSALVQFIAANTQSGANPAGKFTDEYITQLLKHYGIADGQLPSLAHRLDLVPTVHDWLKTLV